MENAGQVPPAAPVADREERMWAMFCHLGGLLGSFLPPLNIILPLVIWLVKREGYPLVDDQGKEALNFQISLTIYAIISAILILLLIGILLLIALGIFALIVQIIAMVKANEGVRYRYPLAIRLVS